jgi:hypothetical protein
MAATAASRAMSCTGAVGVVKPTLIPVPDPVGSADTWVENGLSFPAVSTAVTMK